MLGKELVLSITSYLLMCRRYLRPRETIPDDGSGVNLREVDVRTIRTSCEIIRLDNNICDGEHS